MKWIEVINALGDVSLPNPKERVLICLHGNAIDFGYLVSHTEETVKDGRGGFYVNHKFDWSHGHQDKNNPFSTLEVTHWMPLPKPPLTNKPQNDEQ